MLVLGCTRSLLINYFDINLRVSIRKILTLSNERSSNFKKLKMRTKICHSGKLCRIILNRLIKTTSQIEAVT